jgi:hypothetical protein
LITPSQMPVTGAIGAHHHVKTRRRAVQIFSARWRAATRNRQAPDIGARYLGLGRNWMVSGSMRRGSISSQRKDRYGCNQKSFHC